MVCVRCMDVTSSSPPSGRERAPPHTAADGRRARGDRGRAARLYPHPGRRGARHQPLHVEPAGPPVHRNRRDAVGNEAGPGRRARSAPRRAAPTSTRAQTSVTTTWPARKPGGRHRDANPRRTGRRQEPRPDRPRPELQRHTDRARWSPMVAVNGTDRPRPLESACVHGTRRASRRAWDGLLNSPVQRLGGVARRFYASENRFLRA